MREDSRFNAIADLAYNYIVNDARPYVARGNKLWTKKGNIERREAPTTKLRKILASLDGTVPVTYASTAARARGAATVREHALPVRRILIEMIDPMQGMPQLRSNRVLVGRAESPADVIRIYRELAVVTLLTKAEDNQLNSAFRGSKWDAPNGDWRLRYKNAGIIVHPLSGDGT